MESVKIIHDFVHRVDENGVLAPAFDILTEEIGRITRLLLDVGLDYFYVALDLLLVDAV